MGLTIGSTRKIINTLSPIKCKQRLEDAIKADKVFDAFYDRWNRNSDERLYFYDQSSMSQYNLQDDKAIIEPGIIVYEIERPAQLSSSVTFHCIVDQYGLVLHHDVTIGGTTKLDIKSFRTDAADKLKKDKKDKKAEKPILFLDHLNSHVGLAQSWKCPDNWNLIPCSVPM